MLFFPTSSQLFEYQQTVRNQLRGPTFDEAVCCLSHSLTRPYPDIAEKTMVVAERGLPLRASRSKIFSCIIPLPSSQPQVGNFDNTFFYGGPHEIRSAKQHSWKSRGN